MKYIDTNLIPSPVMNNNLSKATFDSPDNLYEQGYKILHIHEISYFYYTNTTDPNIVAAVIDFSLSNITNQLINGYNPQDTSIDNYVKVLRPHQLFFNNQATALASHAPGIFIDLEKSRLTNIPIEFLGVYYDGTYKLNWRAKVRATAITESDIEVNRLNIRNILNAYKNRHYVTHLLISM